MKIIKAVANDVLDQTNTPNLEGAVITDVNFDGNVMMLSIKGIDGEFCEIRIQAK